MFVMAVISVPVAIGVQDCRPLLAQSPAGQMRRVLETTISWGPRGLTYQLTIDEPAIDSDPSRQRLRIRIPGRRTFSIWSPDGPFVADTEGLFNDTLVAENLARSHFVYLSPRLRGQGGSPLLLLFGYAWMNDPGSLQVLALDSTGYPVPVFASKTFELMSVQDLDGDGWNEMIGKHSFTQCGGCEGCTYDPYAVYSVRMSPSRPAIYRLDLSRRYNEAHYVWAGRRASGATRVDQCVEGRYKINHSRQ